MTPAEQDRALDALVRAGLRDPSAEDLKRLERSLSPYLAAAPSDGGRGTAFKSIALLVGLALFAPSDATRTELSPASPGVVAVAPVAPAAPGERRDVPSTPNTEATVAVADLPNAPVAVAVPAKTKAAVPQEAPASEPRERDESEAVFLHRAQVAMSGDPARALHMLEEHPKRYPHGGLAQERDVMVIDSLVRLGRIDDARARANVFTAQYPQSAHGSRIASLLKEGSP
jgi:hypothetical protein